MQIGEIAFSTAAMIGESCVKWLSSTSRPPGRDTRTISLMSLR